MCNQLVLLALEAGPLLAGGSANGGHHPLAGPADVVAMVARYLTAGRLDADRAETDERGARTRLFVAEQRRVEANRSGSAARVRQTEAALETSRASMIEAARRCTQANSDCTFAEERIQRAQRQVCRWPQLAGRALRTFALERLRQLEEITAMRGHERPSRDRVLHDDLRTRFQALSLF